MKVQVISWFSNFLGTADLRNADVRQKSNAYHSSAGDVTTIPIKGHHTWRWPHVKHEQETEFGVPGMDRSRVIQGL